MGSRTRVAVVRRPGKLADTDIDLMVREAVALSGGLDSLVPKGGTVIIKPNVLAPVAPDRGATTDPRICKSLADQVIALGAHPIIAESSAIGTDTEEAFKTCGYASLRSEGYEVLDLKKAELVDVSVPQGMVLTKLRLPGIVMQADAVFSVAKMKTHDQAIATLALKNMKGVVPDTFKKQFHTTFGVFRAVADLNTVVRPCFSIVDGIIAQEGLGPVFGEPLPLGLLIAGQDPVAVDTVCGLAMDIDPSHLEVSRYAAELGVGTMDMADIEVVGTPITAVRRRFKRASEALEEALDLPEGFELIFNQMACTGCRTGVLSSLWDLAEEGKLDVLRDTRIVAGMMDSPPAPSPKRTIFVGACASKFRYQSEYVKGCPPNNVDIRACITGSADQSFFVGQ